MLPKGFSLVIAAAAVLLGMHASLLMGRAMSEAVLAFCAFALMIAAPIAILVWFGSVLEREKHGQARRVKLKQARSDALRWQQTMHELQPVWAPLSNTDHQAPAARFGFARVAAARARLLREGKSIKRSILALWLAATAAVGLSGCGVPPEAWAMVRPGMGTTQLVSLVGGPDYVRSNGTTEIWQYCRDFPGRDEGRWARYYTAIVVDRQTVREIQPYPVASNAGCEDFYRAEF